LGLFVLLALWRSQEKPSDGVKERMKNTWHNIAAYSAYRPHYRWQMIVKVLLI